MFDSMIMTAVAVIGGPLVLMGAIVFAMIGLRVFTGYDTRFPPSI